MVAAVFNNINLHACKMEELVLLYVVSDLPGCLTCLFEPVVGLIFLIMMCLVVHFKKMTYGHMKRSKSCCVSDERWVHVWPVISMNNTSGILKSRQYERIFFPNFILSRKAMSNSLVTSY